MRRTFLERSTELPQVPVFAVQMFKGYNLACEGRARKHLRH